MHILELEPLLRVCCGVPAAFCYQTYMIYPSSRTIAIIITSNPMTCLQHTTNTTTIHSWNGSRKILPRKILKTTIEVMIVVTTYPHQHIILNHPFSAKTTMSPTQPRRNQPHTRSLCRSENCGGATTRISASAGMRVDSRNIFLFILFLHGYVCTYICMCMYVCVYACMLVYVCTQLFTVIS